MPTLQEQIRSSFQILWDRIAAFLPNFLAAVIVLILGWLVAGLVGQVVEKILTAIQIDKVANRLGMDRLSAQVGRKLSLSALGGWLVKWFIIVAAFVAAADILNLDLVSQFLYNDIIPYFGSVVAAVAILFIGFLAANFMSEVVRSAVRASGASSHNALASITRWAIVIFAVLAALTQLNLAPQALFTGVIAMLALAGGLAFGLGGRDHASRVLDRIERDLTRHD
ncbi:MAG TPA: hypothetical protein VEA37_10755 [Flavobacterium sp.]|nr:hypothetical protein [Flavobacterium sp.]